MSFLGVTIFIPLPFSHSNFLSLVFRFFRFRSFIFFSFFCRFQFGFGEVTFSFFYSFLFFFPSKINLGETIEYKAAAFHFPLRHDSSFLVSRQFFFFCPLLCTFSPSISIEEILKGWIFIIAPPLTSASPSILDFNRRNRFSIAISMSNSLFFCISRLRLKLTNVFRTKQKNDGCINIHINII